MPAGRDVVHSSRVRGGGLDVEEDVDFEGEMDVEEMDVGGREGIEEGVFLEDKGNLEGVF